ncbi:MAG: hypothetical protein HRT45_19875 [Bdellovibrionales bacterium]|nr:hypothetical protein [Bdellovibrionales bacterium]
MLAYPMHLAKAGGVNEAMINLHHLPETVRSAASQLNSEMQLSFVDEQPEILDSGGGIKNVEAFLSRDDNFWVLNGDTVCLFDSVEIMLRMLSQHRASGAIATILACPFPEGKGLGGVFVKDDQVGIDHFSKTDRGTGLTPFHYIGVCLFSKSIFDYLPEGKPSNIFYDGVTAALKDGHKAEVVIARDAAWFETGNKADYLAATSSCLSHLASAESSKRAYLEQLLDTFSPNWRAGFQAEHESTRLFDSSLKSTEKISVGRFAVVGPGVSFGEELKLNSSVLLAGASIEENTVVDSDIVL